MNFDDMPKVIAKDELILLKLKKAIGELIDAMHTACASIHALCYRHWEEYNAFVGVAIYDDRVEIFNPGSLAHEMIS